MTHDQVLYWSWLRDCEARGLSYEDDEKSASPFDDVDEETRLQRKYEESFAYRDPRWAPFLPMMP